MVSKANALVSENAQIS